MELVLTSQGVEVNNVNYLKYAANFFHNKSIHGIVAFRYLKHVMNR